MLLVLLWPSSHLVNAQTLGCIILRSLVDSYQWCGGVHRLHSSGHYLGLTETDSTCALYCPFYCILCSVGNFFKQIHQSHVQQQTPCTLMLALPSPSSRYQKRTQPSGPRLLSLSLTACRFTDMKYPGVVPAWSYELYTYPSNKKKFYKYFYKFLLNSTVTLKLYWCKMLLEYHII